MPLGFPSLRPALLRLVPLPEVGAATCIGLPTARLGLIPSAFRPALLRPPLLIGTLALPTIGIVGRRAARRRLAASVGA